MEHTHTQIGIFHLLPLQIEITITGAGAYFDSESTTHQQQQHSLSVEKVISATDFRLMNEMNAHISQNKKKE